MTIRVLLNFMKRLIKDADRKVYWILDNLRVYHANLVTAWLEKQKHEIEVFYLPAYSPELNPDEYLNCDVKAGIKKSIPARGEKLFEGKVLGHMKMLQQKPTMVAKYCKHQKIAYIA
ncbi:transposase [Desulforhopalus singaporensis]